MNSLKEVSLWKLTNDHQKLLNELYDHETGEVNEIVQAKLDALEPDIEKKCIAVSQWIRKMESEESISQRINSLLNLTMDNKDEGATSAREIYMGTLSLLTTIYGSNSPQVVALKEANDRVMQYKMYINQRNIWKV